MNLFKFGEFKFSGKNALIWLRQLVGIIMIVAYLVAVIVAIRSNFLPLKYILPLSAISSLIVIALFYCSFKISLSAISGIITSILSVFVIIISILVIRYGGLTTAFIRSIQSSGYSYTEYKIVAKKDQHIKLSLTENHTMGIASSDPSLSAVKDQVNKLTKVDYKSYDNIASQTVALDTNESNMLVLSSASIDLIKENYNSFYQNIEVLTTFKIKTTLASNQKAADVSKPFIVYISGIDTYGQISTVSRSDVNILAVLNPQTHKILLVNTPRDYYVQLHGTTGVKDKLTHAGIYGIDMSVNTLEDLYGTQIDYYMRVNFSSLTSIVNELNGVTVNSNYAFSSGKYSFTRGNNQLNGEQALAFSRTRYAFADGDRTRGQNQQLVIEAIVDKMNNPATLLNYQKVLSSTQNAIQTNMNYDEMTTIIRNQLNDMSKWTVESTAVDGSDSHNYTYSMGNMMLYVMLPNQVSVDTAKLKIEQNLR